MQNGETQEAIAIIIETFSAIPEIMRIHRAKWAQVAYIFNDEKIVAENRVQVPVECQVGSQVKIKFAPEHPGRVYRCGSVLY